MKSSKLLKKAKKYLWDGHEKTYHDDDQTQFICGALIEAASNAKNISALVVSQELRREIAARLYPASIVEGWLQRKKLIPKNPSTWNRTDIQTYRHRWLDELIREYEAKGD